MLIAIIHPNVSSDRLYNPDGMNCAICKLNQHSSIIGNAIVPDVVPLRAAFTKVGVARHEVCQSGMLSCLAASAFVPRDMPQLKLRVILDVFTAKTSRARLER